MTYSLTTRALLLVGAVATVYGCSVYTENLLGTHGTSDTDTGGAASGGDTSGGQTSLGGGTGTSATGATMGTGGAHEGGRASGGESGDSGNAGASATGATTGVGGAVAGAAASGGEGGDSGNAGASVTGAASGVGGAVAGGAVSGGEGGDSGNAGASATGATSSVGGSATGGAATGGVQGTGGLGPTGGTSSGGTGGVATGGSPTGGAGGTGGIAGSGGTGGVNPGDPCTGATGVYVLTVPLAASHDGQRYNYQNYDGGGSYDLTGATLDITICAAAATGGNLHVFFTTPDRDNSVAVDVALSTLTTEFQTISIPVPGKSDPYDPATILVTRIEVEAGDGFGTSWQTPATVLVIDRISTSNGLFDDTFDADTLALAHSGARALSGATITWMDTYSSNP